MRKLFASQPLHHSAVNQNSKFETRKRGKTPFFKAFQRVSKKKMYAKLTNVELQLPHHQLFQRHWQICAIRVSGSALLHPRVFALNLPILTANNGDQHQLTVKLLSCSCVPPSKSDQIRLIFSTHPPAHTVGKVCGKEKC